jgi:DNA repair exonuclease SbcCD ATPase subunit
MITFNSIRWCNFMSYGNYMTEVALDQYNKTLIVGKSGSGKSVLIDAITFALFGKPYRNINKPALTNRLLDKNTLVEIEFTIASRHFLIRRGIKPNIFEIFEDGELIRQDSLSRDYQLYLENSILKINYKSFCQIIILGTATYVPFMELPALQRRNVVEDLLDLQVFSAMNTILKDRVASNKELHNSIEQEIRLITSNLELHEAHLKEIKTDIKDRAKDLSDKIADAKETISTLQKDIAVLNSDKDAIEAQIKGYDKTKEKRKKCVDYLQKANRAMTKYQTQIAFYQNSCECPTCSQVISEETKAKEIATRQAQWDDLKAKTDAIRERREKLDTKLKEIDLLTDKIFALDRQISNKRLDISAAKALQVAFETDLAGLKEKYSSIDTSRREEFQNQLATANETRKNIIEEREILSIASTLLKDGGIKSLIIKQYIPIMNKIIKQYLGQMNLFVDFNLDENFEEVIGGNNNQLNSYYAHSEGEKKRINLAIMFAWRNIARIRNSAHSNLLIFDEILDSALDQDGRDDFMNIINSMTDTNIFIISHNTDTITDRFDTTIKFEKKKQFSQMELV